MIAYLHGAVDIQSRQQKIEHQTGDAELASGESVMAKSALATMPLVWLYVTPVKVPGGTADFFCMGASPP